MCLFIEQHDLSFHTKRAPQTEGDFFQFISLLFHFPSKIVYRVVITIRSEYVSKLCVLTLCRSHGHRESTAAVQTEADRNLCCIADRLREINRAQVQRSTNTARWLVRDRIEKQFCFFKNLGLCSLNDNVNCYLINKLEMTNIEKDLTSR